MQLTKPMTPLSANTGIVASQAWPNLLPYSIKSFGAG